jgi:hypothetical protein
MRPCVLLSGLVHLYATFGMDDADEVGCELKDEHGEVYAAKVGRQSVIIPS